MSETEAAASIEERGGTLDRWWGPLSVANQSTYRWRIGPLKLWLSRTDREWRVVHERGPDPFEAALEWSEASRGSEGAGPDAEWLRFGFRRTDGTCRVLPALPDRALVVKPEQPFHLPSAEEITLFISVPLWIAIQVGSPPIPLCDLPVFRPSDSWFGPPTVEDGCCYASRTRARSRREDLVLLAHRAVCVVIIRNQAESQLALERLRLPLPNLSLFGAADGYLWTEQITLEREEDGEQAKLDLGQGPPREIGEAVRIVGPRRPAERGLLTRAFGGLL